MDSREPRAYSPRDVRVALQLMHADPGPMILHVRYDDELVRQGYPTGTRMCSRCGGTYHEGAVVRVEEILTVEDSKRYRCTRCAGVAAQLRIPWDEVQRIREAERVAGKSPDGH